MRFHEAVQWETVFHGWRRQAGGSLCPNEDIWGVLPHGTCWLSATVEEKDVPRLFVIGSGDWKSTFGTYNVCKIAEQCCGDDVYKHQPRIDAIGAEAAAGKTYERIAMVSNSGDGPFVVLDGNHRAVAFTRVKMIIGMKVYVGLHPKMREAYSWFKNALRP